LIEMRFKCVILTRKIGWLIAGCMLALPRHLTLRAQCKVGVVLQLALQCALGWACVWVHKVCCGCQARLGGKPEADSYTVAIV
jgi:hypothetical protein